MKDLALHDIWVDNSSGRIQPQAPCQDPKIARTAAAAESQRNRPVLIGSPLGSCAGSIATPPLRPVSQCGKLLHEPSTGNESHRLKMRWLHWLAERLARVYSGCSGGRRQCRVSGRACIGTGQPLVWTDLDGSSCWQTEGTSPDRATNRLTAAEIPSKLTCWTHNWTGPALAP